MNPWLTFQRLIPSEPLFVGRVSGQTDTDSVLELPQGGYITVRGTGFANGTMVYFKAGQIQSEAPNIIPVEVTV